MSDTRGMTADVSYAFTRDWFSQNITAWDQIFSQEKPRHILEIGSFEGRSACYTIEKLGASVADGASLTCIDNWIGGQEHRDVGGFYQAVMSDAERRFNHNTRIALAKVSNKVTLRKIKQNSRDALAQFLATAPRCSSTSFSLMGRMKRPMCSRIAFWPFRCCGLAERLYLMIIFGQIKSPSSGIRFGCPSRRLTLSSIFINER